MVSVNLGTLSVRPARRAQQDERSREFVEIGAQLLWVP
jgi:hypothetical protein